MPGTATAAPGGSPEARERIHPELSEAGHTIYPHQALPENLQGDPAGFIRATDRAQRAIEVHR